MTLLPTPGPVDTAEGGSFLLRDAGRSPVQPGEMARLVDEHDWSATALGPRVTWPPGLRVATSLMLGSACPMALFWGPERIQLHNDAYRELIGWRSHPSILGTGVRGNDTDFWNTVGPLVGRLMDGAGIAEQGELRIPAAPGRGSGDNWWTFDVSPVEDDAAPSGVGGVLLICHDVTASRAAHAAMREAEARQGFLLALSDAIRPLGSAMEIEAAASRLAALHLRADRAFFYEVGGAADPVACIRGQYAVSGAVLPDQVTCECLVRRAASAGLAGAGPLVVDDVLTDPRLAGNARPGWVRLGLRAAVVVSVGERDGRRVAFAVAQGAVRFWTQDEVRIVSDVAERSWAAAERARAEAARKATESQSRTLVEGVPQLIWRSHSGGQWIWASPQWLDYTGQSQEGSRRLGWLAAVHAEDRAAAMRAWDDAVAVGRMDVEFRVRRASDGAWRWHQTRSRPVSDGAIAEDQAGLPVEWVGASTDIEDLKRLQGQQQVLVAELLHRTRNLLAVVRSLVRHSIGPSPGRDEYDARLAALGRVQGFLSRSPHYTVSLRDIVEAERQVAVDGEPGKMEIGGPAVELPGESVQTVALALHELTTNAVKYGALAQHAGRLRVMWRVEEAEGTELLVIDWHESGVPLPEGAPVRQGYGSELITRALPYQLRAQTRLEFTPDGVHCQIALPASAFTRQRTEDPA